LTLN
jgi:hypothetical protein